MPPLQLNDEHGHFIRAYEISRGHFIGRPDARVPESILSFIRRYPEAETFRRISPRDVATDLFSRELSSSDPLEPVSDDPEHKYLQWAVLGANVYCPIVYLPASFGILLARALHFSPLGMMYLARVMDAALVFAAFALTLRFRTSCPALMAAIFLMPMTLHQAGGISGDAVTIGISLLGFALVLHTREEKVSRQYLIGLCVLFAVWGLCKASVWALPFILLVPSSQFTSRLQRLTYIAVVAFVMVGAVAGWQLLDHTNVERIRLSRLEHGVDVSANARMIAHQPLRVLTIILQMCVLNLNRYVSQFIGAFGWAKFQVPMLPRVAYIFLIALVAITERMSKPFEVRERITLLGGFVIAVITIHAMLFISDATCALDAASNIKQCFAASAGIQGRYFIPFSLAGLLVFRQQRITVSSSRLMSIVIGVASAIALVSLWTICKFYYV